MTDPEIREIVSQALAEKFPNAGFVGAEAKSEIDYDGGPILKIVARFRSRPADPDAPSEAIHEIRARLLENGEERFVLLSNEYGDAREEHEEDVG